MITNEDEARAFSASLCDAAAMARLEQFIDLLEAFDRRAETDVVDRDIW